MNKLKIGFVILTWNSEKFIEKCLYSIAILNNVEPLVIVIDNGSTDQTLSIIGSYIKKSPHIFSCLRYKSNHGTTVTRNHGIKHLLADSPDYICILDSDTEVNDDALILLGNEMKAHPDYGIIGPTLVTSGGLVQVSARAFPTALEKLCKAFPIAAMQKIGEKMEIQSPSSKNAASYPVDYLMSACWLVRPQVFNKAGLLDEKIFYAPEDAEFCIRVWKSGFKVAFCPKASIIHEWQRLSKKKLISKMNLEHVKGLLHMFIKHRYLLSASKLRSRLKKSTK